MTTMTSQHVHVTAPSTELQPPEKPLDTLPSPEDVIANRGGDVLIKHTTLKADHFPSEFGSEVCYSSTLELRSLSLHGCTASTRALSRMCCPGCHNTKLTPILDGAPNYRQARLGSVLWGF